MKIACIVTPNDLKRLNSLTNEMDKQKKVWGGDIEIFTAIMDNEMPRRGISQSHKEIVKWAKEQELSSVLILEDDVQFMCDNALEKLINISKIIPKDCDILFGGVYDGDIEKEFSTYCSLKGRISGLHCYIIFDKFFDTFLNIDENFNLDFGLSNELNTHFYCMYPMVALQYDGYSYNTQTVTNYNYNLHLKYKIENK